MVTRRLVAVTVSALVVTACGAPAADRVTVSSKPTPTAGETSTGISGFKSPRDYRAVAVPVRIRIPGQHIDSTLQRRGLAPDGTIQAPDRWQQAGWYDQGPRPGQEGPAVIVGHIDSKSGPAVFYRLTELRRGDLVYIDRADGTTVKFRVTGRRQFPKNRFPADLVYSPTLRPSLQMITCGGIFNRSTGHYLDNLVVSAVPA